MARLDQRVPQPCLQLCHQHRFETKLSNVFQEIKEKNREIMKKIYETSA